MSIQESVTGVAPSETGIVSDLSGLIKNGRIRIEYFGNGALVIDLESGKMISLSMADSRYLRALEDHLNNLKSPFPELDAVAGKLKQLLKIDLGAKMKENCYVQNPVVNIREQDNDGALLFNPDTDRVQVISITGLHIWNICAQRKTGKEIVASLMTHFSEVPPGEVEEDVTQFLNLMKESGFICIEETP